MSWTERVKFTCFSQEISPNEIMCAEVLQLHALWSQGEMWCFCNMLAYCVWSCPSFWCLGLVKLKLAAHSHLTEARGKGLCFLGLIQSPMTTREELSLTSVNLGSGPWCWILWFDLQQWLWCCIYEDMVHYKTYPCWDLILVDLRHSGPACLIEGMANTKLKCPHQE